MSTLGELPLWQRLEIARQHLEPIQSDYRVIFEADIDHPSSVLVPDPHWMAAAICGGILPPVEVYHRLESDERGKITNGHILHDTPPLGPMSEEEAIEYLIQKDVPAHVWRSRSGNAIRMRVCHKSQLPGSREFRNAWKINQEQNHDNNLH